jgi:fluoride exporter
VKDFLVVFLGGGIGSMARYALSSYIKQCCPTVFPWGTFLVNVLGCFLIGLIHSFALRYTLLQPYWVLLLTVGFCGGFTTFSTFGLENYALLKNEQFFVFWMYLIISVLVGLSATAVGIWLGQKI